MGVRADTSLALANNTAIQTGAGVMYEVQTPAGVLYQVFSNAAQDVAFRKSSDGGLTWSNPTLISGSISTTQLAIWYDRWSGLSADKIHVVYVESVADDVRYRSIDAGSSDTLSAETILWDGLSTASNGCLSITKARSGKMCVTSYIDAGAEGDVSWSSDDGATWDNTRSAAILEGASGDQWILLPGFASDQDDIMAIFWDASSDEISRKLYDYSADTWSETSISTGMAEANAGTVNWPDFAAAVDLTNSRNVLIAWNGTDVANADLKCWTVTESAITAKTDVVLNGTDDQGLAALSIDLVTGYWYAFYAGKSDGSETLGTSLNIYYKVSQDAGTTWGAETLLTTLANDIRFMCTVPRVYLGPMPPPVCYYDATNNDLRVNVPTRRAVGGAGMLGGI